MKLGASHNQVFYAPHVEVKRLIDTGAIGRPVLIRLRFVSHREQVLERAHRPRQPPVAGMPVQ
ncbi:MAG: hypothetical protein ABSB76_04975 [Streptosporangiaceae bacterium]